MKHVAQQPFGEVMPQLSVGDEVSYRGIGLVVHFMDADGEQATCVYKGDDKLLHSITLNVKLLKIKEKIARQRVGA